MHISPHHNPLMREDINPSTHSAAGHRRFSSYHTQGCQISHHTIANYIRMPCQNKHHKHNERINHGFNVAEK